MPCKDLLLLVFGRGQGKRKYPVVQTLVPHFVCKDWDGFRTKKSLHGEENACYHVKEHKKLGQKLMSKVTLHFVWGSFIGKTNSGRGYSRKTMHFLFLPSAFIFPAARLVKVVFLLLFLYRRHLSTFHYLRPQFIWNRLKTLKWPSDMPKSRYWSGPTSILPLAPEYFNCG